jgi:hypothetical protein
LTDLLSDTRSIIVPIAANVAETNLCGFAVTNPKLRFHIRLWLDANHNYLPARIEFFSLIKDNQYVLTEKMKVDEYSALGGGLWLPTKASYEQVVPVGDYVGRVNFSQAIQVDLNNSYWNSIQDGKLFARGSINANYTNRGWRYEYMPEELAIKKQVLMAAEASPRPPSRILVLILLALTVLPLLIVFISKTHENKRRVHE